MSATNKAVFLDRDGVINSDEGHYYIYRPSDFVLCEGVVDALKLLHNLGYLIVIITNQGGVSKGVYTKADVESVHQKFIDIMSCHNVPIAAIYYCPHHSANENCLCRKPQPLMIEKAVARFNIDKEKSFMLGDRATDVQTGVSAGIRGFQMPTNGNLLEAVKECLKAMSNK